MNRVEEVERRAYQLLFIEHVDCQVLGIVLRHIEEGCEGVVLVVLAIKTCESTLRDGGTFNA